MIKVKYQLKNAELNQVFDQLTEKYEIYAPVRLTGKGTYSDTDQIRYQKIQRVEDGCWDEKSDFSPKEVIYPITQTLFYFTEDMVKEPEVKDEQILLFLRPCDLNAIYRLDQVFLSNGPDPDVYYQRLRKKVKFMVIECTEGFDSCFCTSMGTNKVADYAGSFHFSEDGVRFEIKDEEMQAYFTNSTETDFFPQFVQENTKQVKLFEPEEMNNQIFETDTWKEYSKRCIACGRCNVVCPSCSCFTMQDIRYKENPKCGERRRVWAGCHIDGFTDVAGGHGFRQDYGDRMRFKVLHKIYDFNKRFGMHMCVGCGRCDDICPEYISFSRIINDWTKLLQEGEGANV